VGAAADVLSGWSHRHVIDLAAFSLADLRCGPLCTLASSEGLHNLRTQL